MRLRTLKLTKTLPSYPGLFESTNSWLFVLIVLSSLTLTQTLTLTLAFTFTTGQKKLYYIIKCPSQCIDISQHRCIWKLPIQQTNQCRYRVRLISDLIWNIVRPCALLCCQVFKTQDRWYVEEFAETLVATSRACTWTLGIVGSACRLCKSRNKILLWNDLPLSTNLSSVKKIKESFDFVTLKCQVNFHYD